MNGVGRYRQMMAAAVRPIPMPAPVLARPIDRIVIRYAPLLAIASPDYGEAVRYWSEVDGPVVPDDCLARDGARLVLACWTVLAKFVATGGEAAGEMFGRLVQNQQPGGALLLTTASDNPETTWYHELIILHAMTTYGLRSGSEAVLDAARRAALYHLNETQPDHATTQPWGINAFLLSAETYPLVDQLLHALMTQDPKMGADPVSSVLLADTLAGLR